MNEQEASKKAQEMINGRVNVLCPLLKAACDPMCECYKMPEVYGIIHHEFMEEPQHTGTFCIRYGFCTCHALKGDCD